MVHCCLGAAASGRQSDDEGNYCQLGVVDKRAGEIEVPEHSAGAPWHRDRKVQFVDPPFWTTSR
jgi:hypothetical protein